MLNQCFTCLPPKGFSDVTLPSNPYRTRFTPNQTVWMAESPDMFYGLDEVTPLELKAGGALVGAALVGLALWLSR